MLELTGVKGWLMIEAMIFPICVVVGDWLATGGALLVPTLGLDDGGAASAELPATLDFFVVVGFFVVEGIWKTGGAEVGGTTTGTGVFSVTNTVLVKADPLEGTGDAGALVLATWGASFEFEAKDAAGVAAGAKDKVMTVSAGWNERTVEASDADPGEHTPDGQAELMLLDAAAVIGDVSVLEDPRERSGA